MAKSRQTIVIADSDPDFRAWMRTHLGAASLDIYCTGCPVEAETIFLEKKADLLIADLYLTPTDGLALLKKIRMRLPNAMVILNGTHFSSNALIDSMRMGAFDVLRRESLNFELKKSVEQALQASEEMRKLAQSPPQEKETQPAGDLIIGQSSAMQEVCKLIGRVAASDVPVLITGESGAGKEVVANAIHKFSRRATGEYVAINCAAIPGNLLESELFGHEKGSFTGAFAQRKGRFEQCDGGTLFLDEIGDMPMEVQSKLLRVLQSGEFSRVGGNETLRGNVRILAATNKRLEEEVAEGTFREDLFYRLNVVRIHIPPLRQRREDIRLLAEFFLQKQAAKGRGRQMAFSEAAIAKLEDFDWPGNVRELENIIHRACVLATGNVLLPQDIPLGAVSPGGDQGGKLRRAAEVFWEAAAAEGETVLDLVLREVAPLARKQCKTEEEAARLLGVTRKKLESAKP